MTTDVMTPEDDDIRAAEYVLRVMSAEDEARFEARLGDDRKLDGMVAGWVERLAPLSEEIAPHTPSRKVKAALNVALFGEVSGGSFFERLGLWRAISFGATAAAAVMAIMLILPQQSAGPVDPGGIFVSEIAGEGDALRVLAVYDSGSGNLQITRTAGAAAPDRVLELWAINGDAAPVSLGVLASGEKDSVPVPEALRPVIANLVLAISDEPPGGSPTGAPTGAVLAVGPVTEI